jgi:hypothetical protein
MDESGTWRAHAEAHADPYHHVGPCDEACRRGRRAHVHVRSTMAGMYAAPQDGRYVSRPGEPAALFIGPAASRETPPAMPRRYRARGRHEYEPAPRNPTGRGVPRRRAGRR